MPSPQRRIVVDPVCEMDVLAAKAPCISFSGRRIYHFCSPRCKLEFDLAPNYHIDRLAHTSVEARNRYGPGRHPGRRHLSRRLSIRRPAPIPG